MEKPLHYMKTPMGQWRVWYTIIWEFPSTTTSEWASHQLGTSVSQRGTRFPSASLRAKERRQRKQVTRISDAGCIRMVPNLESLYAETRSCPVHSRFGL